MSNPRTIEILLNILRNLILQVIQTQSLQRLLTIVHRLFRPLVSDSHRKKIPMVTLQVQATIALQRFREIKAQISTEAQQSVENQDNGSVHQPGPTPPVHASQPPASSTSPPGPTGPGSMAGDRITGLPPVFSEGHDSAASAPNVLHQPPSASGTGLPSSGPPGLGSGSNLRGPGYRSESIQRNDQRKSTDRVSDTEGHATQVPGLSGDVGIGGGGGQQEGQDSVTHEQELGSSASAKLQTRQVESLGSERSHSAAEAGNLRHNDSGLPPNSGIVTTQTHVPNQDTVPPTSSVVEPGQESGGGSGGNGLDDSHDNLPSHQQLVTFSTSAFPSSVDVKIQDPPPSVLHPSDGSEGTGDHTSSSTTERNSRVVQLSRISQTPVNPATMTSEDDEINGGGGDLSMVQAADAMNQVSTGQDHDALQAPGRQIPDVSTSESSQSSTTNSSKGVTQFSRTLHTTVNLDSLGSDTEQDEDTGGGDDDSDDGDAGTDLHGSQSEDVSVPRGVGNTGSPMSKYTVTPKPGDPIQGPQDNIQSGSFIGSADPQAVSIQHPNPQ
ncbi:hypothetical protein, conserved, partial [Babesia bigemina]